MYLKKEFLLESRYKEGNQRIYYLLQSATNGGGAAHIVRWFAVEENGHAAWQALIDWYEGSVMTGKISRTIRTKLWSLCLHPRGDANKFINVFVLYSDKLKELGREERERGP